MERKDLILQLHYEYDLRYSDIANILQTSNNIVRLTIQRTREGLDSSLDLIKNDDERKIKTRDILTIKRPIRTKPNSQVSLANIREQILENEPNRNFGLNTLWRFMRTKMKMKYNLNRIQNPLANSYLNKIKRKIIALKLIEIISMDFNISFIDESSLSSTPAKLRQWMNQSDYSVLSQPQKKKNLSLISAIDLKGHRAYEVREGSYNQESFLSFLEKYISQLRKTTKKAVILFLDNARIHKTAKILAFFKEKKVYCSFNSPYSPQLNPIEYMFGAIKAWFKINGHFER